MQTVEFAGKSLVGIIGDTGAGKSTLLEAITLALYGSPSWKGGTPKNLIADGVSHMTVDLTFICREETWRVRRRYSAGTTASSHLLKNLDTGKEIDNHGAVSARIVQLLKLNRKEFQTAVLLPQGEFGRLLKASDTERVELLKGIFGTRDLETVRDLADDLIRRIGKLHKDAELRRGGLLENPEAIAASATELARDAAARGDLLSETLDKMRNIQAEAQKAKEREADLAKVLARLDETSDAFSPAALPKIIKAEERYAQVEEGYAKDEKDAKERASRAETILADARELGFTSESVGAAGIILAALPRHLSNLDRDRGRIAAEQQRLKLERSELAKARSGYEKDLQEVGALAALAADAKGHADLAATRARTVAESVHKVFAAARLLSSARATQAAAHTSQDQASKQVARLTEAEKDRRASVRTAVAAWEDVLRYEAAHTASIGLSAGDTCTVCARELPIDFCGPAPSAPDMLKETKRVLDQTTDKSTRASTELATAQAALKTADTALATAKEGASSAEEALSQALITVSELLADDELTTVNGSPSGLDQHQLRARLARSAAELSNREAPAPQNKIKNPRDQEDLQVTEELCRPVTDLVEKMKGTADRHQETWQEVSNRAAVQEELLKSRETALTKAERAVADLESSFGESEQWITKSLADLPAEIRRQLAATPSEISTAEIKTCTEALETVTAEIRHANSEITEAGKALASLARLRLTQEKRKETEITEPLRRILTPLTEHMTNLRAAEATACGTRKPAPIPPIPQNLTSATIVAYEQTVLDHEDQIKALLDAEQDRIDTHLRALTVRMEELVASVHTALEGAQTSAVPQAMPHSISLYKPADLDPVSEAVGQVRNIAKTQAEIAERAKAQIVPARRLDEAIQVGARRLADLEAIHKYLASGKFIQYLIERRTQSLLLLGNNFFSRLTQGRLGFTADFQIINLATRNARGVKTLSGGESFLASLALALALVELHSRNGARLGSLFLDEGFGSLDSGALSTALSVLHEASGGDKLVTVISHLHAVAETVDDVLLVEQGPSGSQTRWLTPDQRDAFIYGNHSSGLLNTTAPNP